MTQVHRTGSNPKGVVALVLFIAQEKSDHHLGAGNWVVRNLLSGDWVNGLLVMSFRSEAFSLDFCHIKFWRGCLRFLVKRRQPFA